MTTWSNLLTIAAGAGGLTAAYVAGRRVYDDVSVRVMQRRTFQAKLDAFKQVSAVKALRHIPSDANGRLGLMVRPDGTILNYDTHARLDEQWRVAYIDPLKEQVDHLTRLLLAQGPRAGGEVQELMPEQVPLLPDFVTPEQVARGAFSYRRLILGKTESGECSADMADLVHFAVGGSSGWGKSVFVRWIVYQLIKSIDPVQLALIDLEGVTLSPFANSDRVLWPVADSEQDAVIILSELAGELDRRKEMYSQYRGVDSLYLYNERAMLDDKEALLPIVTVVDEATAILENKSVERHLRTLAIRARKYGLWLVMAGQDWKGTSLDTTIRNQIGARIHFRAQSSSQSRVLLGVSGAEELEIKGRALMVLPGEKMQELQTPMLRYSDIRGLKEGGPLNPMPVLGDEMPEWTDEYLRELWSGLDKKNKSEMCRALWADMGRPPPAPTGGSFWGEVDQAGKGAGLWD